jgi:hypothetical protein
MNENYEFDESPLLTPEDRYRRDSLSEGRYRKNTPERDEKKVEKPKVENNPPSPREIAGIPVSLPWKHMTKAKIFV